MYSKAVKVSSETRIHFRQTSISLSEAANKQITGGKSNRDSTGDLRCFICDGKITGTCFPLVVGVTPYSKTDIPTKIGQLMGEGFMVVVSEDDNLCKRCTSLLYQLDRLEVDLNLVKDALTNYLKLKYQLNEEDHEIATNRDDSSFLLYNEEENENDKASCKKLCGKEGEVAVDEEFKDGCENIPGILSSTTKSPKKINAEIMLDERLGKRRKKKRRTTDALGVLNGQSSSTNKEYKCSLCELKTPDISVYKAHSCNKYEGIKCENDFKSSQGTQKQIKNIHSAEWLCHICDMIFEEENMLASHIQTSSHNDMVHHKLQSRQPGNKKTSIFIFGEYTCSICNFKTGSIATYRDHQQFHFQNPSEYESSCKSFLKRAHGQKSNSYKTDDHFVDSTEKGSEQRVIQEELTCNLQNGITKDGFNILKAEDKVTVDTNYKMTENQKLATEDRIPNTEHYFCSSCSLVVPSDRLLQHHKNVHHTLPSLRKETLLTTEITSHNFCDLQQKGCLDSNKSSNQYMNNENFMNLFKKVSTQFMQVPNRNNNNLNGTELAIENVSRRATSNSTTCTKSDCDSSQHADGEIDYTVSGKNEQQSATTQNSTFENSTESLVTTHRSHSSEATQVNNSIPCNFPINKFMENARTDSAVKQKGNSEKNVSSNSSHEYLLGAPYRNIQKSELVSENGTESTKQKDCEMKAKVDNETSLSDSCGSISYPPQTMKEMRTPFLFHITKPGTAQCEICGKFFSSNSKMLYHRDICSKNLSCKLCNKHFLNMNDLHKHNSEKHQTHKMHHNCMHCSASFLTKELCLTHEENCVFVPYCDECGEKFSEVDQLRSHKDTTHRDPHCRHCGKEILKLKTLRYHELRHMKDTAEKFECSECEKVFKTKTGLRHHFALHTGQYKFCCDYCGRGFMSRMMMEEHRSKHTKEERYICDVCGRKFCFQSTYWIHRKWHDNPFPYKCNFCGRKFRHSSLLAVHKRKHTGERPYKCPHCPLTFPVGGTLKRHIILHTGVYPYNCEVCKRGFTTRHKFAIHLSKIHGDSKMLNEKSRPNEFKMVIRDNETVKKQDNVEPSAEWQNPDDSEQVDMNFRLGSSAGGVDNFDHLEGAMSCSLVPDELLVGNAFATRVVEIVLDDTSQAVAAVTVADPEAHNLPDLCKIRSLEVLRHCTEVPIAPSTNQLHVQCLTFQKLNYIAFFSNQQLQSGLVDSNCGQQKQMWVRQALKECSYIIRFPGVTTWQPNSAHTEMGEGIKWQASICCCGVSVPGMWRQKLGSLLTHKCVTQYHKDEFSLFGYDIIMLCITVTNEQILIKFSLEQGATVTTKYSAGSQNNVQSNQIAVQNSQVALKTELQPELQMSKSELQNTKTTLQNKMLASQTILNSAIQQMSMAKQSQGQEELTNIIAEVPKTIRAISHGHCDIINMQITQQDSQLNPTVVLKVQSLVTKVSLGKQAANQEYTKDLVEMCKQLGNEFSKWLLICEILSKIITCSALMANMRINDNPYPELQFLNQTCMYSQERFRTLNSAKKVVHPTVFIGSFKGALPTIWTESQKVGYVSGYTMGNGALWGVGTTEPCDTYEQLESTFIAKYWSAVVQDRLDNQKMLQPEVTTRIPKTVAPGTTMQLRMHVTISSNQIAAQINNKVLLTVCLIMWIAHEMTTGVKILIIIKTREEIDNIIHTTSKILYIRAAKYMKTNRVQMEPVMTEGIVLQLLWMLQANNIQNPTKIGKLNVTNFRSKKLVTRRMNYCKVTSPSNFKLCCVPQAAISVNIAGFNALAVLDTGASVNATSTAILKRLQEQMNLSTLLVTSCKILAAVGGCSHYLKLQTRIKMGLGHGAIECICLIIVNLVVHLILGHELLRQVNGTIDFTFGRLVLTKDEGPRTVNLVHKQDLHGHCYCAKVFDEKPDVTKGYLCHLNITPLSKRFRENKPLKHSVFAKTKPGAMLNAVVENITTETSQQNKDAHVVIIGGGNDVYKNKTKTALRCFHNILPKLFQTNIVITNVPVRHDLPLWSCVNKEIRHYNSELKKLCGKFSHVHLIDLSKMSRDEHTKHGFHLNRKGKAKLVSHISKLCEKDSVSSEEPVYANCCNKCNSNNFDSCKMVNKQEGTIPLQLMHLNVQYLRNKLDNIHRGTLATCTTCLLTCESFFYTYIYSHKLNFPCFHNCEIFYYLSNNFFIIFNLENGFSPDATVTGRVRNILGTIAVLGKNWKRLIASILLDHLVALKASSLSSGKCLQMTDHLIVDDDKVLSCISFIVFFATYYSTVLMTSHFHCGTPLASCLFSISDKCCQSENPFRKISVIVSVNKLSSLIINRINSSAATSPVSLLSLRPPEFQIQMSSTWKRQEFLDCRLQIWSKISWGILYPFNVSDSVICESSNLCISDTTNEIYIVYLPMGLNDVLQVALLIKAIGKEIRTMCSFGYRANGWEEVNGERSFVSQILPPRSDEDSLYGNQHLEADSASFYLLISALGMFLYMEALNESDPSDLAEFAAPRRATRIHCTFCTPAPSGPASEPAPDYGHKMFKMFPCRLGQQSKCLTKFQAVSATDVENNSLTLKKQELEIFFPSLFFRSCRNLQTSQKHTCPRGNSNLSSCGLVARDTTPSRVAMECFGLLCVTVSGEMGSDSEYENTSTKLSYTPEKKRLKRGEISKTERPVHRQQKFRYEWLHMPGLRNWLVRNGDPLRANKKHLNMVQSATVRQPSVAQFITNAQPVKRKVAKAEIKLSAFLAEHNVAFLAADHLSSLLKDIFPDSDIARAMTLKQHKARSILSNVIGTSHKEVLAKKLQHAKFSIMMDESTDIGTVKNFCLAIRFYDKDSGCIETSTAEYLYDGVVKTFQQHNIPFANIIGFGADGCNTMMGVRNSVASRFRDSCSGIFVMKLYFTSDPHKLLHPSQTRWLSRIAVVRTVLENWDALMLFFNKKWLSERVLSAEQVFNCLHDSFAKMYSHHLEDSQLYLGVKILKNVGTPEIKNHPHLIKDFYHRCRNFLVTALCQIKLRYDMEDKVLSKLVALKLTNALSQSFQDTTPSLMPLMELLPRIIPPSDLDLAQTTDDQWRRLPLVLACLPDSLQKEQSSDKVWNILNNESEEFKELSVFALSILSLPHSNADCERVFSEVNLMKTKIRNRLQTSTLNGALLASDALKADQETTEHVYKKISIRTRIFTKIREFHEVGTRIALSGYHNSGSHAVEVRSTSANVRSPIAKARSPADEAGIPTADGHTLAAEDTLSAAAGKTSTEAEEISTRAVLTQLAAGDTPLAIAAVVAYPFLATVDSATPVTTVESDTLHQKRPARSKGKHPDCVSAQLAMVEENGNVVGKPSTEVPRKSKCFVCDVIISDGGVWLMELLSVNANLLENIGSLMGDGAFVIVSWNDIVCNACSLLLKYFTKLERDLMILKKVLRYYLKVKYRLEDDGFDTNTTISRQDIDYIAECSSQVLSASDTEGSQLSYRPQKLDLALSQKSHCDKTEIVPRNKTAKVLNSDTVSDLNRKETNIFKKEKLKTCNVAAQERCHFENYHSTSEHCKNNEAHEKQLERTVDADVCVFTTDNMRCALNVEDHHSKRQKCFISHSLRNGNNDTKLPDQHDEAHSLLFKEGALKHKCPPGKNDNTISVENSDGKIKNVISITLSSDSEQEFAEDQCIQSSTRDHMPQLPFMKSPVYRMLRKNSNSVTTQENKQVLEEKNKTDTFEENKKVINQTIFSEDIIVHDNTKPEKSGLKPLAKETGKIILNKGYVVASNSIANICTKTLENLIQKELPKCTESSVRSPPHSVVINGEQSTRTEGLDSSDQMLYLSQKTFKRPEKGTCGSPGSENVLKSIEDNQMMLHNPQNEWAGGLEIGLDDDMPHIVLGDEMVVDGSTCEEIAFEEIQDTSTHNNEKNYSIQREIAESNISNIENLNALCSGDAEIDFIESTTTEETAIRTGHEENANKASQLVSDTSSSGNQSAASENSSINNERTILRSCDVKTRASLLFQENVSHLPACEKLFECHICNRILTTQSNLKRHLLKHEKCTVGSIICELCNEQLVDRVHLKQHLKVQHQQYVKCAFCDKEFSNMKLCRDHELTHPERATYKCDICNQMFVTEGRLKNHKELIHDDLCDTFRDNDFFKCHICFKTLRTHHNLKRHLTNHEKPPVSVSSVSCNLCQEVFTEKSKLYQHREEKHPKKHNCTFCNKEFLSLRSCRIHESLHPERVVYKCNICETVFLTELRLNRHKDIYHREPYCRICRKEITDRSKLIEHERRHGRFKQVFMCKECPKVFRTASGLKYHMSVHTGKYAVYCEICGKGLHSEVVLAEHKATHTKEVRYTCELCGRTFSSNSTYRMHRLWHDNPLPYQCNFCDKKFKHTSILAVHKRRVHTGERPYKCKYCNMAFSVSSTLNKHLILHTKQYPFKCEQCNKGFTTRTKIANHLAKVHNDDSMLIAGKKVCEYKMALRPSEMADVESLHEFPTDETDEMDL
ncbi:uncharacterized protein LOC124740672 [Schistocerca piceifrons]|uniref:uncharacterized protein LOC124740672 n=1 Tax=Schistocerca piceifrons TaxID=274613 RepID=UPI001F5E95E6|nr:uncharacterized protein LOC124740672 [Schistocerca piceifrons]